MKTGLSRNSKIKQPQSQTLYRPFGKQQRHLTTELGHSRRKSEKGGRRELRNLLESPTAKSSPHSRFKLEGPPTSRSSDPIKQELKRSFSTAEINETKPNPKKEEKSAKTSATAIKLTLNVVHSQKPDENVSVIPETDPNLESDEFDTESNDSSHHHAPPPFITKHVPTATATTVSAVLQPINVIQAPKLPPLEESKQRSVAYLTPRRTTPVLLANVPIFKRNFSPLGEDAEDFIGVDIELSDETPTTKKESNKAHSKPTVGSHTTTDNSSGCPSDVFVESASPSEKEQIGPQNFLAHKLLGKGSFGEVYLVEKVGTKTFYAMKVLSKAKITSQNLVKYALTERKVLSSVNHPFIVRLHFAFQSTSKLFLVLDYCAGGDLSEYLRKEKKFTEDRARIYVSEILLALEYLHKKDIIFRDLKPDNVVLDNDGHALLTDFGLSKEGVYDNQGAKSFCGSLAYLAPEMIRRTGHGKSVDWYLLGVLLYEMLVGVPPYYSTNK